MSEFREHARNHLRTAAGTYKWADVTQRDIFFRGYPKSIRVDQGSEFVSRDLDLWAYQKNVVLDFSRPGKPTDNAHIEAFNSRLRQECLNASWFLSMDDARTRINDWKADYNETRPHSSLGNLTPCAFAAQLKEARKVA